MPLFYAPDIETTGLLPQEEAAHCLRVLRLRVGDPVEVTDGRGSFFRGLIAETGRQEVRVEWSERTPWEKTWDIGLHLAVAPTKNMDRTEWLCEKACEIGFDRLTFLDCRYSERRAVKEDRIRKILIAAMKQSLKGALPVLEEMCPFRRFVQAERSGRKLIAHCHAGEKLPLTALSLPKGTPCTVLIGPEGDFSEEEVDMALAAGYEPVSLGPSRLRTETAALTAVTLLNLLHSKQELLYSEKK